MFSTENLTFTFETNGITAVDAVSLNFESGRIHALLGENGAGKSTFARLCTGHLQADRGRIRYNGTTLNLHSPRSGITAGLVLVPQHPQLSVGLTVWENLIIGQHPQQKNLSGFLHSAKTLPILEAALGRWGIKLPLRQKAGTLDSAQLHWTAIAEALLKNPLVLFLDEPSAAFSPQEIEHLYVILRRCAEEGMCVVTVTHRIQEVLAFMDTVHVLRNGKTVRSSPITVQTPAAELLQDIFGTDRTGAAVVENTVPISADKTPAGCSGAAGTQRLQNSPPHSDETGGLILSHIYASDGKGIRFSDFSLRARCGTITGVVGIKKQGLELLEDILIQAVQPEHGTIRFSGKPLARLPREVSAYIPSKRMKRGIARRHSIAENLYTRARGSLYTYGIFSKKSAAVWNRACPFDIPRSWAEPAVSLSGGMMQKLIFSRELDNPAPQLVICGEPYWGLDRRVQTVLLNKLRSLAAAGAAVLVLTSDADAALETCDCIHIVYRGEIIGFMDRPAYNRAAVIAAMMQTDHLL